MKVKLKFKLKSYLGHWMMIMLMSSVQIIDLMQVKYMNLGYRLVDCSHWLSPHHSDGYCSVYCCCCCRTASSLHSMSYWQSRSQTYCSAVCYCQELGYWWRTSFESSISLMWMSWLALGIRHVVFHCLWFALAATFADDVKTTVIDEAAVAAKSTAGSNC